MEATSDRCIFEWFCNWHDINHSLPAWFPSVEQASWIKSLCILYRVNLWLTCNMKYVQSVHWACIFCKGGQNLSTKPSPSHGKVKWWRCRVNAMTYMTNTVHAPLRSDQRLLAMWEWPNADQRWTGSVRKFCFDALIFVWKPYYCVIVACCLFQSHHSSQRDFGCSYFCIVFVWFCK